MQSSQQYRDPPPYPGHSKQLFQPGLRQSFSGSETSTDVSVSSTENLCTSQRQEPQGEETTSPEMYFDLNPCEESNYSILARLGMPTNVVDMKAVTSPRYFLSNQTQGSSYQTDSGQCYTQWQSTSLPVTSAVDILPGSTFSPQYWSPPTMEHSGQVLHYNLPPPPEYPRQKLDNDSGKLDLRRSYEMLDKVERTRSQPDLSRFVDAQVKSPAASFYIGDEYSIKDESSVSLLPKEKLENLESSAVTCDEAQIISLLREKNRALQEELLRANKRVTKLQKCEDEIDKMNKVYQFLEQSSKKLQNLEAARRCKLEEEIKKLKAQNKELKEQLQGSVSCNQEMTDAELKRELIKKEAMTANLTAQNKELTNGKERLENELLSLHKTVRDQQSQIEILDSALTNAQSNVVQLEEECQKKQLYMERLDQLQKAFGSLQLATEKREQMERQLRTKLENELECFRISEKANAAASTKCFKDTKNPRSVAELWQIISEKDAKILQLEKESAKWEKRSVEENQQQGDQLGAAEDMKQLAFQKSCTEAEKLRHMEEAYQANRAAGLDAQVKTMQTQLVEKDAMIKALQRCSMTRSSSVHTLYCSPIHSPRPSLISTGSLTRQSSQSDCNTFRDYGMVKHVRSGSANEGKKSPFEESLQNVSSEDEGKEESGKLWQV